MSGRWTAGDAVVLREVCNGRVFVARPVVVVEDSPSVMRFCVMPGSVVKVPVDEVAGMPLRLPLGGWTHRDGRWDGGPILSFAWPHAAHAVLAFFDDERLAGWYVNLQDPLRRTAVGFDTVDHCLDVVVSADRSTWRWKDEEELGAAIEAGLFTREDEARFRAEGERAVRRLLGGEPPFDRDWSGWRPDPSWRVPELPARWDAV